MPVIQYSIVRLFNISPMMSKLNLETASMSKTSNMAKTLQSDHSPAQKIITLLHDAENCYRQNHPNSQKLHEKAIGILPGGNTRSVLHTDPFPIYMDRGEGNRLIDVDGHE